MKPNKSNMENSRGKKNTYPSPKTKSFHSAIFDSKRASVIDPPTNCISLLFMIRVVNSNIQLGEQKHGGEEKGGKKFPSPLEKFREYALCRPLKEAKAIEVSLNKLQKTSPFPTLF